MNQQAQTIPSRDPNDPNFRRLWYVRYADDFLLGVVGSKSETLDIKQKITTFLRDELKLELSDEKTLVTHARDEVVQRIILKSIISALLADLKQKGCFERPEWMVKMSARKRKTLVVYRQCHENIQYGRYDGERLTRKDYRKAK